jgi:hypothetical protein
MFAALTVALALATGCASPGSPLPPSLKLPQTPTDLTATRVGSHVVLRWTTPARTTDRVLVTGPVTAEVCRDSAATTGRSASTQRAARQSACNVVTRVQVNPGSSQAEDTLPPAMTTGAPAVLAYRVQLLNAAGRTAGPTAAVYAPAGAAPEPLTGLRATSTKPGVVLEWIHPTGMPDPGAADSVELDRVLASVTDAKAGPARDVLLAGSEDQTESRFSARDTGGAIDRTAQAGKTYRYTVQRVWQVPFQGKTLESQSEPSAAVEVAVQSVFPPDMPKGLIGAPAYSELGKPAVDLSWEPNVELHVAGYKVYRRSGVEPWRLLTQSPVTVAAYRDADVTAGDRFTYRVTAVNDTGMESPPSAEVTQSAPTR